MLGFLRRLSDNNRSDSYANKLRQRRFGLFAELISTLPRPVTIIDIGGTSNYWHQMGLSESDEIKICLVNKSGSAPTKNNISFVKADACNMHVIADKSFDVAFSNSVIEHVGNFEKQSQMVREMRRVSSRIYLQTPNRGFPIEPHFLFPFFQFLPTGIKVWLIRHFNLGWYKKTSDKTKATLLANSAILLNRRQLRELFPEAKIFRERFLGLTKSFVVVDGDWNYPKER